MIIITLIIIFATLGSNKDEDIPVDIVEPILFPEDPYGHDDQGDSTDPDANSDSNDPDQD